MNRTLASVIAALALFMTACSRDIQSKEAVRQAVIDHLSGRQGLDLDLSAMSVDVTAVTFRENEAEATVSFQPKGGGGGMSMQYTLERQGNRWTVKTKTETGGSPHGEGGMGAPPQGDLPPGHPPVQNK
jgi:hypothetical protein